MKYTKKYLSIEEQRGLLMSRGMMVPDPKKCDEYLQRIGYYRLSAYWFPFRQLRQDNNGDYFLSDDFKPDTTFKHTTDLYAFDKGLRLIALDALERIEVSVRTELALALGSIDPFAHRSQQNFNGRFSKPFPRGAQSPYQKWLGKLDEKSANSKEEFAVHFRKKYPNSNLPIWIAVELLDFSPLSIALSQLKQPQRTQISESYGGTDFRLIQSWIRSLCNVRNTCAHHSRLWNKPLVNQPALPRNGEAPLLDHISTAPDANRRLYAALAVMCFLLKTINPRTNWASRLKAHIETFPFDAPNIKLQDSGFPDNWHEEPLWN